MRHLIGILAWVGGNLNNNFQKSRMPGRLPGAGGGMLAHNNYYIGLGSKGNSESNWELQIWCPLYLRLRQMSTKKSHWCLHFAV